MKTWKKRSWHSKIQKSYFTFTCSVAPCALSLSTAWAVKQIHRPCPTRLRRDNQLPYFTVRSLESGAKCDDVKEKKNTMATYGSLRYGRSIWKVQIPCTKAHKSQITHKYLIVCNGNRGGSSEVLQKA